MEQQRRVEEEKKVREFKGFWCRINSRGPLPCPRSLHAGAVYGSSLYIFGGYDGQQRCNDLHRYNFQTNCWTAIDVPVITPSRRDRHSAVIYGNLFVVFGGFDGRFRVNDIHAFDLDQNIWQEIDGPLYGIRVLPTPRHSHSAVVYGQSMFIFGGYDGSYCGDFHMFSFVNRTWTPVTAVSGEAPSPRYRSTCIVHADNMILHGGHDGNRHLNDTFLFNFATQGWSLLLTEGLPPSPRDSHVAIVLRNSMFIFGGSTGGALGDLHELDLDTLTWAPVISFLPTAASVRSSASASASSSIARGGPRRRGSSEGSSPGHSGRSRGSHTPANAATASAAVSWSSPSPSSSSSSSSVAGGAAAGIDGLSVAVGGLSIIGGGGNGGGLGRGGGGGGGSGGGGGLLGVGSHGIGPDDTSYGDDEDADSDGPPLPLPLSFRPDIIDPAHGMVPIANPGSRFCHIGVMYEGALFTFGGYDGSHRLNDFLKFTFINELPAPEVPASTLVTDLKHFVNSDMHSDITFVVEGMKVPAHKILCMRCPYFHNMLTGEFMESRAAEVAIEDVKHETFLLFLEYLYSDHVDVASADVAMDLFEVADRFGVERLKKICEGELVASIKIDNAAQILLAADAFNAERLRERCLSYLVQHFDDVSKTPCFEEMARVNLELLFEVLRLR